MYPLENLNRRAAIARFAAIAAATLPSVWPSARANQSRHATGMGLVAYTCNIRRKWLQKKDAKSNLFEPLTFLKHCHSLGAGGIQVGLGVMTVDEVRKLRDFAEQQNLFIEGIINSPASNNEVPRFEAEIKTATSVGARAVRTTIMPGRRYERFQTLAEFREYENRGRAMLQRSAPIVEKHQVPLAVENHKDQRIEERIALFKHLDSEFVGACVDTGNSFALLDDPYGAVEALAPYAFSVHLKDQALQPADDGFWLGDTPLGQGSFDLSRMVAIVKKTKPDVRFSLELITRDPLKVPCLTDAYWSTMPTAPGKDLARTLRFVRDHPAKLQRVSSLPFEKQLELEHANVDASLRFAREELQL